MGKIYEAIELFKKAIELDPDYKEALNNLGITYVELGQFSVASDYLKQSLNINKIDSTALIYMGICFQAKVS